MIYLLRYGSCDRADLFSHFINFLSSDLQKLTRATLNAPIDLIAGRVPADFIDLIVAHLMGTDIHLCYGRVPEIFWKWIVDELLIDRTFSSHLIGCWVQFWASGAWSELLNLAILSEGIHTFVCEKRQCTRDTITMRWGKGLSCFIEFCWFSKKLRNSGW